MKKIKLLITLVLFTFCFSGNAQSKLENKAKKISNEITEVLSLNKSESQTIYKIQLARFEEGVAIKKEFEDQPEIKKERLKKLGNKVFNEMKNALGKERLKKWKDHKSKN